MFVSCTSLSVAMPCDYTGKPVHSNSAVCVFVCLLLHAKYYSMTFNEKFVNYTVPHLKQYLQERSVTVAGYRRPLLVELANAGEAVDRVQLPCNRDFQNVARVFLSVINL
jgi:hypothetical protein